MTSFTFDTGIPNANNNPSIDQPGMQINNVSIDGILAVDHVSFETDDGGTHKKVTYINKITSPTLPVTGGITPAIAFTANGLADTNTAQNYYKNAQGTFPLSCIRAFVKFATVANGTPVTLGNRSNVTAIADPSNSILGNLYRITLAANAVSSTDFLVFITLSGGSSPSPVGDQPYFYLITSVTQLDLFLNPLVANGIIVNVLVIQI